jgi:hypothetical protein
MQEPIPERSLNGKRPVEHVNRTATGLQKVSESGYRRRECVIDEKLLHPSNFILRSSPNPQSKIPCTLRPRTDMADAGDFLRVSLW